ncbi:MAG TPA: DUF4349 domain-containing protein [Candidatus Limnocylindrales bacterium]|jgi:hypothetical protein|nr:DUF4349 domain-containing protein [Candidatus Limnocylindrales bacterium]
MNEDPQRHSARNATVVVALLLIGVVGLLLYGGGQTPRILSTVGSAVGPVSNGGSSDGSTSQGTGGSGDAAGAGGTATGGTQVADAAVGVPTLLIVRTGTLELEVASIAPAVAAASSVVSGAGGYVSGSDEAAAGDRDSATVAYRIPAAAWDATLDGIRRVASTVRHQQVTSEEVSGQVVDLGARIANLRATEAAFQAIMARATKISDVLDVQKQLSDTRGEIERLVADKTQLEGRAAFGSLKVTFNLPAPPAVVTAQKGWDPAADVDRATGKLIAIGQRATSVSIFLGIVGLPVLIVGGVFLLVAWQLYRLGRWVLGRRGTTAGMPG